MTGQQELYEIEQVIRSVLTPNSYIVPQEGIELTKALLDWHNKQVEEVLDRLEGRARGAFDYEADIEEYAEDVLTSIEAERTRLRGDDE